VCATNAVTLHLLHFFFSLLSVLVSQSEARNRLNGCLTLSLLRRTNSSLVELLFLFGLESLSLFLSLRVSVSCVALNDNIGSILEKRLQSYLRYITIIPFQFQWQYINNCLSSLYLIPSYLPTFLTQNLNFNFNCLNPYSQQININLVKGHKLLCHKQKNKK
jgi:hypothetical protein